MARKSIKGEIISPGISEGDVRFLIFGSDPFISKRYLSDNGLAAEIARFEEEVKAVVNELNEAVAILEKDSLFDQAEIVRVHILMLQDAGFHKKVHQKIQKNQLAAEIAVAHVLQEMISILENSDSELFSQRAADFKDIGMRLRKKLTKEDSAIFYKLVKDVEDPVVAVKELLPSLVLEAKERGVRAFIVEQGTSLSHAAILAKSFGIPVLRINNLHNCGLKNNENVVVDAMNARLLISPSEGDISEIERLMHKEPTVVDETQLPAKLWINIVDPLQINREDLKGIEGVGLYRTELLFMKNREDFPTEDEQFSVYASLFKKCRDYTVTIRTLDIGGDKTLPYFSLGPQENPYLGFRAHRIFRFHPEIFITQVRAILKAGLESVNLRILYPMIESVNELFFVQELLAKAVNSLKEEGVGFKEDFQQGVLIEVPSAVWNFRELLQYVDFANVGTNDLLQYFFAVDRNNANVYKSYQPENPVALQMLKNLVDVAKELNKPLSICGEIASDVNFLPLLIGLGFDALSIDSHAVPTVKKSLLSLDISECRKLTQECLRAKRTDDVRTILNKLNSFRQRAEPSSLVGDSEAIDPVCKMVVHTEGNNLVVTRSGKKFYFCCKQCRDRFIKDSENYISIKSHVKEM